VPRLSVDLDLVLRDHTLLREATLAKVAETPKVATKNLARATRCMDAVLDLRYVQRSLGKPFLVFSMILLTNT
jgi:predicted nucleotidyltransferase component of viral defense system